jgi:hypothetical protein
MACWYKMVAKVRDCDMGLFKEACVQNGYEFETTGALRKNGQLQGNLVKEANGDYSLMSATRSYQDQFTKLVADYSRLVIQSQAQNIGAYVEEEETQDEHILKLYVNA